MNRERLLANLPPADGFHRLSSLQRKQATEAAIGAMLDEVAANNREPDEWESRDIAAAIGFAAGGMYNAALSAVVRALTPEEMRAPIDPRVYDDPPPTLRHLRHALEYVELQPAKNH